MYRAVTLALLAVSSSSSPLASAQSDFFECPDEFEGYYPHDLSCDKFWECKEGIAALETCGNGLAFDDLDPTYTTKNCDYLYNVECGNRTEIEPAISAPNCPRLYGTFEDPDDCTGFYNCRDGEANRFSCAPGLAYDSESRVCKWADQVQRCKELKLEFGDEEEGESEEFVCPNNVPVGIFSKHAHPEDCRQYFVCIAGTPREYGCPLGTVFKIGQDEFDGKCADPEDVPECANYYGDLEFDKQDLVRSGVDPEAVGVTVRNPARVRARPPVRSRPVATRVEEEEDEEEEIVEEEPRLVEAPRSIPRPRVNSNSFRNRPSRTRPSAAIPSPVPASPSPSLRPTRPRVQLPQPVRNVPVVAPPRPVPTVTTTTTTTTTTAAPRPAVPAIPLSTLANVSPSARPAAGATPAVGSLGQPAKVKANEDYYYYYYYYDEDYPEEDADAKNGAAAAAGAASAASASAAAAAAATA